MLIPKHFISKYEDIIIKNKRIISNKNYGFNGGGIYNPDIIKIKDKKYLIARCESNFDCYNGIYESYWKSVVGPMYFEIDENHQVRKYGQFEMKNFPSPVRYEDFRIFKYKGRILTNHNITTPNYNYNGESNWPNMNISTKPGIFVSVGISEIDIESSCITYLDTVDLGLSNMEKNWSFFSHREHLHFIYSLDPFVAYAKINKPWRGNERFQGPSFVKLFEKKFNYHWNVVPNSTMKFCISSNLKRINDSFYLLFFHTKTHGYKYVQGCMLLDNNLNPVYMTKNPILESEKMIGKYKNVLYVFSIDDRGEEIDVYYGEADTNCCVVTFDKKRLVDHITNSENSFKITKK